MTFTWRRSNKQYIAMENPVNSIRKEQNRYIAHRVFGGDTTEHTCASLAEAKAYCNTHARVYRLVSDAACCFVTSFEAVADAKAYCDAKNRERRLKQQAPDYFYQMN